LKGIILQSPYTSAIGVISSVGEMIFNIVSYIGENPNIFRSIEKIHKIKSPIVIIHGKKDRLISYSQSISLLKRANNLVQLILIPEATHSNIDKDHYSIIKNSIINLLL
jgi:pimeloyl-ACP methyl ester carboxylesterase